MKYFLTLSLLVLAISLNLSMASFKSSIETHYFEVDPEGDTDEEFAKDLKKKVEDGV